MPKRVRHHTSDGGLAGIRRDMAIRTSRGWMNIEAGVHVELEPFGSTKPSRKNEPGGPSNELRAAGDGAYVEFDAPDSLIDYYCGPRLSGIIPIAVGEMLAIADLHPEFVKV